MLPWIVRINSLFYCFVLQKELCRFSNSHVPWILTNLYILRMCNIPLEPLRGTCSVMVIGIRWRQSQHHSVAPTFKKKHIQKKSENGLASPTGYKILGYLSELHAPVPQKDLMLTDVKFGDTPNGSLFVSIWESHIQTHKKTHSTIPCRQKKWDSLLAWRFQYITSYATQNSFFLLQILNPTACFGVEIKKHSQQNHLELFDSVFSLPKASDCKHLSSHPF